MRHRKLYLDLARIIAALMVVMIHVSGWFLLSPKALQIDWDTQFFGSLAACAVPVFFMISGALILPRDYELSKCKLLKKILKILIIWFIWNAFYAIADMKSFSFEKLAIWSFKGHFHFWFFEYLIGVYLLAPILKALIEYKNGDYVLFFIICWVCFGILRPTADGFPIFSEEIHIVTGKIHYELAGFSGYFVLGYFLDNLKCLHKGQLFWAVIFFCAAAAHFLRSRFYPLQVIDSFTPFVMLEAICLFLFCKQTREQILNRFSYVILPLSASTLGIYILHPFILEHLLPDALLTLPVVLRVIILFVYVLAISTCISLLLGCVKPVKKWMLSI